MNETPSDSGSKVNETLSDSCGKMNETLPDSGGKINETLSDSDSEVSETLSDSDSEVSETVSDSGGKMDETVSNSGGNMNKTLSDSGIYHHFTWEVRNFFNLPSETDYFLQSVEFRFAGDLYCLRLYPRGTQDEEDCGIYVDILLVRLSSPVSENEISYEIGYRSSTGGEFKFECLGCTVECAGGVMFCVKRSELEKNRDTRVPDDTLTVYCRIRMNKLIVLSLYRKEEQRRSPGVDKLQSDYKRLMREGAESDACLVVRGKEFKAHKCVLRARSPIFEAMFGHETAEKESGRVIVDDLKPDRFQDFLEYLYTGRVESFSDDNVFGLYSAAYKYDVPTLKSECVEYMVASLSVDSICDVITVALRHPDKDLMALAVEFFKKNLASIILTSKWQRFMSENSTRANELLIKAIVPGKESKLSTITAKCASTKE